MTTRRCHQRRALRKLSSDGSCRRNVCDGYGKAASSPWRLWDDESAWLLSHDSVRIARETGTLSELALALSAYSPVLVFCGELTAADRRWPRRRPCRQRREFAQRHMAR